MVKYFDYYKLNYNQLKKNASKHNFVNDLVRDEYYLGVERAKKKAYDIEINQTLPNPYEKGSNDWITQEIKNCKKDIFHFCNYIKILDPADSLIQYEPYLYQRQYYNRINENKYIISDKCRQVGFSVGTYVYLLWHALFKLHQTIEIISINDDLSKDFLRKLKKTYNSLPEWFRSISMFQTGRGVHDGSDNKHELGFGNGSLIKSLPRREEGARSGALSILVFDEAAFIEFMDKQWRGSFYTIHKSKKSKALVISTRNGTVGKGKWYHDKLVAAENDESNFSLVEVEWWEVPDYLIDPSWIDEAYRNTDRDSFLQEVCKRWLVAGETVLDKEKLLHYKVEEHETSRIVNFKTTRSEDIKGLHIFRKPQEGKQFAMTCFPYNERIRTDSGIKKIGDINKKDKVFDINGNLISIINKQTKDYSGDLIEVLPYCECKSIESTPEHPYYISKYTKQKRSKKKNNNKRYYDIIPQFIEAEKLKKDDWIILPNIYRNKFLKRKDILPYVPSEEDIKKDFRINDNSFILKEEFWKLMGLWLAKGFIRYNKNKSYTIYFCLNKDEIALIDFVKETVSKLFKRKVCLTYSSTDKGVKLQFGSKLLCNFIKNNFKEYAKDKNFSEWIKYLPNKLKLNLFYGYFLGDGSLVIPKNQNKSKYPPNIKCISVSYELLKSFQDILYSLDILSSINILRRKQTSLIKGKEVNKKEAYQLIINSFYSKKLLNLLNIETDFESCGHITYQFFSEDFKYIYKRIRKISKNNYSGKVYNLETETHTYIMQQASVHNCDVGTGSAKSFSGFHVWDMEDNSEVAEYRGKINTKEYSKLLIKVGFYYNEAIIVVERNNPGEAVISDLVYGVNLDKNSKEKEDAKENKKVNIVKYPNIFRRTRKKRQYRDWGWVTSNKTRPLLINDLIEDFDMDNVLIRGRRTINEALSFIWNEKNGKPCASSGATDDLVLSWAIYCHLRTQLSNQTKENVMPFRDSRLDTEKLWNIVYQNDAEDFYREHYWLFGKQTQKKIKKNIKLTEEEAEYIGPIGG